MSGENNSLQADLIVYGGTEAGIFCAVTAARCGLRTILISEMEYLFGFFPSLGAWETHYTGCRAPLSFEVENKIIDYYRARYGEESDQFRACVDLEDNNPMVTFEPHVAEQVLTDLVSAEENLKVYPSCNLVSVTLENTSIQSLQCRYGGRDLQFTAKRFADCSYTGDLGAMAGAEFSLGRESRQAFNEPHAGRIFTRWVQGRFPQASLNGSLNILPTWTTTAPLEGGSGEGDDNIQDYSYRICLSCDPENKVFPEAPSGYSRDNYAPLLLSAEEKAKLRLPFHHRWITQSIEEMMENDHLFHGHALPCNKRSWNATNLTGEGKTYATTDEEGRRRIEEKHLSHALGLLYFLQNDAEVPEAIQKEARRWTLAKDEFEKNGNLPPSMYIREARRFHGRYFYREQDCLKADSLNRAPIHRDGVAFTEFALDSLACSTERIEGSLPDGQFFEKENSLPGSLPWRCLLPKDVSNLVSPASPSVTHCAWGTVRQTACLLHLAEVSAYAIDLSIRTDTPLPDLPIKDLQLLLSEKGAMISFFNDFDMEQPAEWKKAALLFSASGFFCDYNARPNELLDARIAEIWADGLRLLQKGSTEAPTDVARRIRDVEISGDLEPITEAAFRQQIDAEEVNSDQSSVPVTRKKALEILILNFRCFRNGSAATSTKDSRRSNLSIM